MTQSFSAINDLIESVLKKHIDRRTVISFEQPSADSGSSSNLMLNLYLYSLKEHKSLRNPNAVAKRNPSGNVNFFRSPLRLECSYFVTAWSNTKDTRQELDELTNALRCLYAYPEIDESKMQTTTQFFEQDCPIRTVVALPENTNEIENLWRLLDIPPKPAFIYSVIVELPMHEPIVTSGPPVIKREFESSQDFPSQKPVFPIIGKVLDEDTEIGVGNVQLSLFSEGQWLRSATSNSSSSELGEFTFLEFDLPPYADTSRLILELTIQGYEKTINLLDLKQEKPIYKIRKEY